jgi:hypothetical protein
MTDSCVCGSTVNHTAIRLKTRAALHTHCHDSRQVNLSGSSFDTLLAAYTGTAVNALTPVASNDNCTMGGGSPGASCITWSFTQGIVYHLQVDGVNGAKGNVSITLTAACVLRALTEADIAGDSIASPISVSLSGLGAQTLAATTVGATREVGEPVLFPGLGESASIWFSWTAPCAGVLRVSTAGSLFNTVLGVYSITATSSLAPFGSMALLTNNDNCTVESTTSCVSVTVASPGARYLVKVDGAAGAQGPVAIAFSLAAV